MQSTSVPADAGTPSDDESLTVGGRICSRRGALGLSQAQLATRMKTIDADYADRTDQSTFAGYISRWERGKAIPDEYNRSILAMALGVEVSELGLTVDPRYPLEAAKRRGISRRHMP